MQTKRISSFFLFLALMALSCSGTSTSAPRFKSPEDAITRYFEALAENDLAQSLQVFAIEEMGENFDFERQNEFLGGAFFPFQALGPSEYPFYGDINKQQLSAQASQQMKIFIYSLLSHEDVASGSMIQDMDAGRASAFVKDVDPKRLSGLKVSKIELSNSTVMETDRYKQNAEKIARVYGADDSTERVVLFTFEGDYYYVGFSLLSYEGSWKIRYLSSPITNTNPQGAAIKTTPQEFESMINK